MNLIMLSAIPLFVVGLMEDVKKGEGTQPLTRLFVAAVCSLIAISIFGISIERLDIPMVDQSSKFQFLPSCLRCLPRQVSPMR